MSGLLPADLGQSVTCDKNGLVCVNANQPSGKCHDYLVQFYCSCKQQPGKVPINYTTIHFLPFLCT